jgi:hypothetical protein
MGGLYAEKGKMSTGCGDGGARRDGVPWVLAFDRMAANAPRATGALLCATRHPRTAL